MRQPDPKKILEWKKRRGPQSGPAYEIIDRIKRLEISWKDSKDPYLAEFIPIRITTFVEVYAREIIQELIDTKVDYREAAAKLIKNARLDIAFAASLWDGKLSIGDFVAHSVSINGTDAVISVLSTLINDFVPKLQTAHEFWTEDAETWPLDPIIEDYEGTIAALAKMFEARHVLTHELPAVPPIEKTDIGKFFAAARDFIDACDWVVVKELHGSVPRTQAAMNASVGEELNEALSDLKKTLALTSKLSGINARTMGKCNAKWEEFANLQASVIASQVKGGTMEPMVWASAKKALVQDRVEQLKRMIDDWMH